jgi:hypothetical protein
MKKLANETFHTDVELSTDDSGSVRGQVKLKWSYEIEARDYGIKGISVIIPEQKIAYTVEETDEDGEDVEVEKTLTLANPKVEYEGSSEHGLALFPTLIEVWRGKVTVTFHRG